MDVDRKALIDAITATFSLAHGAAATTLLDTFPNDRKLTGPEAGKVLAAILAELPPQSPENALAAIDRMSLVGARLQHNGESIWLGGDCVRSHPALAEWTADTLAEQLAMALEHGAKLVNVAVTAPLYNFVTAVQVGPALECVVVTLEFPQTNSLVWLNFGGQHTPAAVTCYREISGNALLAMGLDIADAEAAEAAEAAAIAASVAGEESPRPETVH